MQPRLPTQPIQKSQSFIKLIRIRTIESCVKFRVLFKFALPWGQFRVVGKVPVKLREFLTENRFHSFPQGAFLESIWVYPLTQVLDFPLGQCFQNIFRVREIGREGPQQFSIAEGDSIVRLKGALPQSKQPRLHPEIVGKLVCLENLTCKKRIAENRGKALSVRWLIDFFSRFPIAVDRTH